jgi:hypothetical protein
LAGDFRTDSRAVRTEVGHAFEEARGVMIDDEQVMVCRMKKLAVGGMLQKLKEMGKESVAV